MADAVHTAIGFNDPFTWLVTRITPANMAEIPVQPVVERERHGGAKHAAGELVQGHLTQAPESCTGKNDRQRSVCLGNRGCVRALYGVVWPIARR